MSNPFDTETFHDTRLGRRLGFLQRQEAEREAKDAAGHAAMLRREDAKTGDALVGVKRGASGLVQGSVLDGLTNTGWAPEGAGLIGFKPWRDSVPAWHKGAPPHDGTWLTRCFLRNVEADQRPLLWNPTVPGKEWCEKNAKGAYGVGGISTREWFGHAPDAEGWIKWDGGECPLPGGVAVDVVLRSGSSGCVDRATDLCWGECGDGSVIAYRVLP